MLIVVAVSVVAARILTAPGAFSVNDVSRWATVRALVDTGSYSIGRRYEDASREHADRGILSEPGWETIDLVMHPNTRWLLTCLPEADRWTAYRWGRGLAYVLLAISIGSAMFALTNPWRHNWLFVTLRDWGWVSYP